MPSWSQVEEEIKQANRPDALDIVRRKYLDLLYKATGRNVIAYYSGWLQKPGLEGAIINDNDKNGLMATIHGLDRSKGLDLILHTPGGDMAATESIVDYLHRMFGRNIRAIIPQLAMSAGTMISCACKEIVMGKQSSLGPIDPQFNGVSTHGVIEEFERAKEEVKKDPSTIPIWQTIISHYHPTFVGDCEKAMDWAKKLVGEWLNGNMFDHQEDSINIPQIVKHLSDHGKHKSHGRHINIDECKDMGLKIVDLEGLGDEIQDLVLTVHHSYMHTFSRTAAFKIIENQMGVAMVHMAPVRVQGPRK